MSYIYTCEFGFVHSSKYIKMIVTASSFIEARVKFINKCMARYSDIKQIDLNLFCEEYHTPTIFNTQQDLLIFLKKIININTIECCGNSFFSIEDKYD